MKVTHYWLGGLAAWTVLAGGLDAAESAPYIFIQKFNLSGAQAFENSPALLVAEHRGEELAITAEFRKKSVVKAGVISAPKISRRIFALRGEIKYDQVAGDGFLEMWTQINGKRYFSRSLAEVGPLRKVTGESDWREFILPLDRLGVVGSVEQVEFNVVLPQGGNVFLRDVALVDFRSDRLEEILAVPQAGAWWSDRVGGWIGALMGTVLGTFGGIVGFLARRRPRFCAIFSLGIAAVGVGLLLAGLSAFLLHQPYGVWYPLVLAGLLSAGIFGMQAWRSKKSRRGEELRRMAALDAGSH